MSKGHLIARINAAANSFTLQGRRDEYKYAQAIHDELKIDSWLQEFEENFIVTDTQGGLLEEDGGSNWVRSQEQLLMAVFSELANVLEEKSSEVAVHLRFQIIREFFRLHLIKYGNSKEEYKKLYYKQKVEETRQFDYELSVKVDKICRLQQQSAGFIEAIHSYGQKGEHTMLQYWTPDRQIKEIKMLDIFAGKCPYYDWQQLCAVSSSLRGKQTSVINFSSYSRSSFDLKQSFGRSYRTIVNDLSMIDWNQPQAGTFFSLCNRSAPLLCEIDHLIRIKFFEQNQREGHHVLQLLNNFVSKTHSVFLRNFAFDLTLSIVTELTKTSKL
jgi:hypothetical protein